ncbi:MAG: putative DNA-binding transcriptional regulator AlpA [Candidatus Latescibacterota bacterium]|jgi:predicted DNA-binding transcriptional regulator AlpA
MSTHRTANPLLTTQEAAHRLGIAIGTLQNWRVRGEGPAFVKLGKKAVRYDPAALDRFVAENQIQPPQPPSKLGKNDRAN